MSTPYSVQILTIFPEFFDSPLATGVVSKGIEGELFEVETVNIRDFATDKHRTTDDVPYGGGAGMVMKPEPLVAALEHAESRAPGVPRIYLTPQGQRFDQQVAEELARLPGMILVCGRYEGIDERVREGWIDRELSLGDFVLTGGEPAALVITDAVVRLLPDVLGNPESLLVESFTQPRLDHPHYTRPREFRGRSVPDVLLSGHHARIDQWRAERALERTTARRPDLLDRPPRPATLPWQTAAEEE